MTFRTPIAASAVVVVAMSGCGTTSTASVKRAPDSPEIACLKAAGMSAVHDANTAVWNGADVTGSPVLIQREPSVKVARDNVRVLTAVSRVNVGRYLVQGPVVSDGHGAAAVRSVAACLRGKRP